MTTIKPKWYVGHRNGNLSAFRHASTPTSSEFGHLYGAVVGPFRTKRAALWAERCGYMNPHFLHVDDAERLSRA